MDWNSQGSVSGGLQTTSAAPPTTAKAPDCLIKPLFTLPDWRGFHCLQLMQMLQLRDWDGHWVHGKRVMRTGVEV